MTQEFLDRSRIAYFTMEAAISPDIPTYSGGLGILAGDAIRTAADLDLPFVAVTLVCSAGYFRQRISPDGEQIESPDPWDPAVCMHSVGAKVVVPIADRSVWVGAWLHVVEGHCGGREPVLLLDTNLPENQPEDRGITAQLYGGDAAYRFKQEIVLGIGGVRLLRALGFRVHKYHMNEGHAALLALELLRGSAPPAADLRSGEIPYDLIAVRRMCIFTTHTPVGAGHDVFDYGVVEETLGNFLEPRILRQLAGEASLDMTQLALSLSGYVNGVAKLHAETSRRMYPGYAVQAVTNGVHARTWTAPSFSALFDHHMPGWCHEPEILVRARCCLTDAETWQAHITAKRRLVELIRSSCGATLHDELPIIGFARRMTAYKRPELLFTDLARLKDLARRQPFQIIWGGKAHPRDQDGKERIKWVCAALRSLAPEVRAAYLPNYDMTQARIVTAGVDLWLNTPQRPMEASGTSGMKAALNGVPSLSVLDGWWVEGCVEGMTGWAIGDPKSDPPRSETAALYDKLEHCILPLFHGDRTGWIAVMKGSIALNGSLFNSHRMLRRYAAEAYL